MQDLHLFTPRVASGERLRLQVSAADISKVRRGGPWSAIMTDIPTGRAYYAEGADCGADNCFCDAIAQPITKAQLS